ncbi:MAG: hypothetical protein V6Z86_07425 [Hyphomicrobiales bacterium]
MKLSVAKDLRPLKRAAYQRALERIEAAARALLKRYSGTERLTWGEQLRLARAVKAGRAIGEDTILAKRAESKGRSRGGEAASVLARAAKFHEAAMSLESLREQAETLLDIDNPAKLDAAEKAIEAALTAMAKYY